MRHSPRTHRGHLARTRNAYTMLSRHPTTRLPPATTAEENTSPANCFSPTTTPLVGQSAETTPGTEQAKTRGKSMPHPPAQGRAAKHGEEKTGLPRPTSAAQAMSAPAAHRTFLPGAGSVDHGRVQTGASRQVESMCYGSVVIDGYKVFGSSLEQGKRWTNEHFVINTRDQN